MSQHEKSFLSAPPVHQGIEKTLIDESFSRYVGAFCCPVPQTLLLLTRIYQHFYTTKSQISLMSASELRQLVRQLILSP